MWQAHFYLAGKFENLRATLAVGFFLIAHLGRDSSFVRFYRLITSYLNVHIPQIIVKEGGTVAPGSSRHQTTLEIMRTIGIVDISSL